MNDLVRRLRDAAANPYFHDCAMELFREAADALQQPAPSGESRDAARYRWLRENWYDVGEQWWDAIDTDGDLDRAIDEALSAGETNA